MAFYDGDAGKCPTCSSDSSSESDLDDPYAYQLPPRRAYGGVRISYVPNDRFALSHSHRHLGGRRSLRVTPGPVESPAPPPHIGQLRRETQSQDRTDKDKCIIS